MVMKRKSKWLPAIIVALICYALFSVTGKIYADNDNLMIGVVTSGEYSNDVYCQYLHPLLCLIIYGLSFIFPTADCFLVITSLFVMIEFSVLTYISLLEAGDKPLKQWEIQDYIFRIMLICGIVFLSTAINLWSINYTAQTASFVFAGMIGIFVSQKHEKQEVLYILGIALIVMGFMMRIEAALIFIPYIILVGISEVFSSSDRRQKAEAIIKVLSPGIIIVVALLISRSVFWSIEPHASSWKYNEVRTITGDFAMKKWTDVAGVIENTDKTEYDSPIVWSIFDTDVLNTEKLTYIAEIGSISRYPLSGEGLMKTLAEMKRRLVATNLQLLLLFVVTALVAIRNLVCLKNRIYKYETLLAILGSFIILFYFTFRGRAPLRVWQSVLFAALAVMILAVVHDQAEHLDTKNTLFMLGISIVLYFSIGQVIATGELHAPETAFTARINVDESEYDQTLEEDSLFIWPSFWQTLAGKYVEKGKMPSRQVLEHNIPLAYWSYGQVYFNDMLDRIGAPNPAKALLERSNTYLVRDPGMDKFVLEYMQAHYGDDLSLEEAGEVNGYKYFRLVREGA